VTEGNDQRKLQSLILQSRSYQAALEDSNRQAALVERALDEISAAIDAVKNLPASDSDALVPLGAGVFTRAKLAGKGELIVSVGSDIFVSKSAAETVAFLEDKMKRLEANSATLRAQMQKLSDELNKANAAAEELYAKLQGQ
jgi:prefoldin alpha subunit